MVFNVSEIDYALQYEKPTEPTEGTPQYYHKMMQYNQLFQDAWSNPRTD
jgi:hypothetical protein